jgi:MoxR-like ATPase
MNDASPAADKLPVPTDEILATAQRLSGDVLSPLKQAFVGKDEIIDVLAVALVAGEHVFLLGPPGTAKSAIVQELARRIEGRVFDYLLTRFTEPNELFGPFDIRRLREGDLVTNTEGMLPEASLVFLDELLNANSAILNSLLMVLNERVFRRGRETRALPLLMVVSASNHLPEDSSLAALFDRFLLRVRCDNVADDRLADVLTAGWRLDRRNGKPAATIHIDDVRRLQAALAEVNLTAVQPAYVDVVCRLRQAGIAVSDRRAVKLQRLLAASALVCGRMQANTSDLWVLRYIWDTEEQREVIGAIVQTALERATDDERRAAHPRSAHQDAPNAEELARDVARISAEWRHPDASLVDRARLRDQLSLLGGRSPWVANAEQRASLDRQIAALWQEMGPAS